MIQPSETVLGVIPGTTSDERLLLVLLPPTLEGGGRLQLRQQSWAAGLGWFTQSSVAVDSQQVAELRAALGGQADSPASGGRNAAKNAARGAGRVGRTARASGGPSWTPTVLHADSA